MYDYSSKQRTGGQTIYEQQRHSAESWPREQTPFSISLRRYNASMREMPFGALPSHYNCLLVACCPLDTSVPTATWKWLQTAFPRSSKWCTNAVTDGSCFNWIVHFKFGLQCLLRSYWVSLESTMVIKYSRSSKSWYITSLISGKGPLTRREIQQL